jgi:hypothetical protein
VEVTLRCPTCRKALVVSAAEAPSRIRCGGCGSETRLVFSEAVRTDTLVDRCPLCEGADFYARKDFDPRLGLAIVGAGALVSAAFYWYGQDLIAYGVLAGAVLVDLLVYGRLADVTVCYRCHAEFRGAYRPTAPAFDLHTADLLEAEYRRRRGAPSRTA